MTSKLLSKPFGKMDWYDLFSFVLAQFGEKGFYVIIWLMRATAYSLELLPAEKNISCP